MRIALLIVFVVMIGAGATLAQVPGSIAIFNDAQGSDCEITATTGVMTIHVIHLWTDGATGSQFKVELPPCILGLGSNHAFGLAIGEFYQDVSIVYSLCLSAPIYLGSFLASDLGCGDCTYISVVANDIVDPFNRGMTDCSPEVTNHEAEGGQAIYKSVVGTCGCDVPVEDTTWGQIKSLFE